MKSISMSPALSRIYDNNNKLDSQLTILSSLLSTNGAETQELIHAANIAWDINHKISCDIPNVLQEDNVDKITTQSDNLSIDKEDVSDIFRNIHSMFAALVHLNVSNFTSGDLDNVIGVTQLLVCDLEKKITPLLAD